MYKKAYSLLVAVLLAIPAFVHSQQYKIRGESFNRTYISIKDSNAIQVDNNEPWGDVILFQKFVPVKPFVMGLAIFDTISIAPGASASGLGKSNVEIVSAHTVRHGSIVADTSDGEIYFKLLETPQDTIAIIEFLNGTISGGDTFNYQLHYDFKNKYLEIHFGKITVNQNMWATGSGWLGNAATYTIGYNEIYQSDTIIQIIYFHNDPQNPDIEYQTPNLGQSIDLERYTLDAPPVEGTVFRVYIDKAVNVDEISDEGYFTIFPNPNKGTVNFNRNVNGDVRLFDIRGKELQQIKEFSGNQLFIRNDLSAGLYYLEIDQNDQKITLKIILAR